LPKAIAQIPILSLGRSLSVNKLELLDETNVSPDEAYFSTEEAVSLDTDNSLPEQVVYESLKRNSHHLSLEVQLKLMMAPNLRQQYETYIGQKAKAANHISLVPHTFTH